MLGQRRWAIGIATSFGLTITSGLAFLAHYFVNEFSRPHVLLDDPSLAWGMPKASSEPPLTLQRALLFKAIDGTLLCGDFWAQPVPAPTVVLCHGYRISRSHLRPIASLEYACGYNVLFFDFRGHGDSDSVLTTAGNAEVRDLEAALFVAAKQPETLPRKIIIHGFSMGASIALLTPPHPDVAAIVADSPYARSDDIMRRLLVYRLIEASNTWPSWLRPLRRVFPALAWCITFLSTIDFRLRFGFTVVARPSNSFRRWKARSKDALQNHFIPILLIHSAGDTLIPIKHAKTIAAEAKAQGAILETYFVEDEHHCGAYGYNPQQYDMVLRTFLTQHLCDDPAEMRLSTDAS
jgi:alpha-beta hydrolase superfamily lysophospholipase